MRRLTKLAAIRLTFAGVAALVVFHYGRDWIASQLFESFQANSAYFFVESDWPNFIAIVAIIIGAYLWVTSPER